mmetsp:Transcript_9113/g.31259  ORF Transcript_9113/g.31259 Transcript_9113/m.31259 type:complete len:84 (+) Transcript_9113:132-383(+)
MSLVSARLELFGTESVAHDHFFKDFVLLETSLPTQLLIDATASHELTSFHPTTAQVSTSGFKPLGLSPLPCSKHWSTLILRQV